MIDMTTVNIGASVEPISLPRFSDDAIFNLIIKADTNNLLSVYNGPCYWVGCESVKDKAAYESLLSLVEKSDLYLLRHKAYIGDGNLAIMLLFPDKLEANRYYLAVVVQSDSYTGDNYPVFLRKLERYNQMLGMDG